MIVWEKTAGKFLTSAQAVLTDAAWVGAISQAIAALVAAAAIYAAVVTPRRREDAQRSESTREVIRAANMALEIYQDALAATGGKISRLATLEAKARMLHDALYILSQRPGLTDGSVNVATGSMTLLKAVIDQHAENIKTNNGVSVNPNHLLRSALELVGLVQIRAAKVVNYALKKSWHDWERIFQTDENVRNIWSLGEALRKLDN